MTTENSRADALTPCVHADDPKACYRVRCQLGGKCVDDDMSPRQPAAAPISGMERAFSSSAMSRRDELELPGATDYIDRFVDALGLLCRSKPPKAMCEQWLKGENEELQSWAASNARIYWQMGIGTIEAAQHLADNPEEGEGHEGFTSDYAVPAPSPADERAAMQDAFERSEFYFNGESPVERADNWKIWVAAWKAARRPVRTFVKDIITGVAELYRAQGMNNIAGEILSLIDAARAASANETGAEGARDHD